MWSLPFSAGRDSFCHVDVRTGSTAFELRESSPRRCRPFCAKAALGALIGATFTFGISMWWMHLSSCLPPLSFPTGRPLKLVIFSDVHYGEGEDTEWGPSQDRNSTRVMRNVLTSEVPDFVVFLGDLVTGENLVNSSNASDYLAQMLSPVAARGIPFASAYGNHDVSQNLPREEIFLFEKRFAGCRTDRSDPGLMPGVSNYALDFQSGRPGGKEPAFRFVFLDSQGSTGLGNHSEVPDVNWVSAAQLQFLRRALEGSTPTYVFVHIPPPQYGLFNAGFKGCVGLHDESTLDVQGQDLGLWDALYSRPNVVAVFSGHDHGSAWCCPTQRTPQLHACFARHTGYGGYGDWARGARMVLVDEMKPYEMFTWVSMEDGSLVDHYPKTFDENVL